MMVAKQTDNVVVDKLDKKEVLMHVAIPSDSNIRKKEHGKLRIYQGAERGAGKAVGSKSISGTSGNRSNRGCNPQDRRVAPQNPRDNV